MSAIRDTILNNLYTAYTPNVTRYDSHKKSELRSTYNSIVKINKESPWYLPVTSQDVQGFAIGLKEGARQLRADIAALGGLEENGLLSRKQAYSSDQSVVTAQFIGSAQDADEDFSFDIQVKELASAQQNLGTYLPSNDLVELEEDTYSFDVNISDMNYEFQFSITDGETNFDVQNRLARLINNSGIGLHATVDSFEDMSSLRIESERIGLVGNKEHIFSISDDRTSKTSGAVSYFGLDFTAHEASNARFVINGEEREASSNQFTVGKMFELNLNGVSFPDENTTVGLKADTEYVAYNISQLAGSYNQFLKKVNEFITPQAKNQQLAGELTRIADYYGPALRDLGLDVGEDGFLTVDEDKLASATNGGTGELPDAAKMVTDFTNALLRKSNQISINPMEYVQRTVVAYKNPGHNFASPYMTSNYSGMLYNYYC